MQKLKPLLEYQAADLILRRMNKDLAKNPDIAKLEKVKVEFADAKKAVSEAEDAAGKSISILEASKKDLEATVKLIEKLTASLAGVKEEDEEKRKEIVKELTAARETLNALDKKVSNTHGQSKRVIQKYKEANELGKKLRDLFTKTKDSIEDFNKKQEPIVASQKTKVATLKKAVDASLLDKYAKLATDGKLPVLVEGKTADNGKSFSCGGCGFAISHKYRALLLESGVSECDTCHRMLYKN